MRTNGLMTLFGFVTGLGGVPLAVMAAQQAIPSLSVPHWWASVAFIMIVLGIVGGVGMGVTGKGEDTHSTVEQVRASTAQAKAADQVAIAASPGAPSVPPPKLP
jgi:hypothetical protein